MNTQPVQPIPADGLVSDQSLVGLHDMPELPAEPTVEIGAGQLARIAEVLNVIDEFLRCGNDIAGRLADYLEVTGLDRTAPSIPLTTTRTCSSTSSASPPTACARCGRPVRYRPVSADEQSLW